MDGILHGDRQKFQAGRVWGGGIFMYSHGDRHGMCGAVLLSVLLSDGGGVFAPAGASIYRIAQEGTGLHTGVRSV